MSTNFERTDLDFQELAMRQAISHAIDRQAIVTALLSDLGSPLYGPITPADIFYDPGVEQFNQFDLDKAKSMVAELGWTPGDDGILTKNGVRHAFSPGRPIRVVQPRPGVGPPGLPRRARYGGHRRGPRSGLLFQ